MKEYTEFGRVLEKYRVRKGLSQEALTTAMAEMGYKSFGQRMYSHLLYNPAPRVYPNFFEVFTDVLGLSFAESHEVLTAWLAQRLPGGVRA